MEFCHLGNGQTFPPIAPNVRIYAVPATQENHVEIFCLTPEGIVGSGVSANWAEITGVYYDDDSWEIILRNYTGGECVSAVAIPASWLRRETKRY
ncbi:hypothetical protein [Pseudomonas putida]|uniref:hypothetical protein n=1 Tax=Pseudomonas putida TaxID=303 RepID=UPI00300EA8B5